jgi:hypothetical protein
MEAVIVESQVDMNKIVAIPVKSIKVSFNIRYGWDADNILDAYKSGIDDLKSSIRTWGFKPNEPLEVYASGELGDNGLPIYNLVEGHRRFAAIQHILSENPDYNFGNGLSNGEVWAFVSQKPESTLLLLASQIDANKSQGNTGLDKAKAISFAIEFAIEENKKSASKKAKSVLYLEIGSKIAGLQSWQSVESFYHTYQLPDIVKDWIQESELNKDIPISLTFSTAADIVTKYKVEKSSKLLTEALNIVIDKPETVKLFGNKISKEWLHDLAVKMKLVDPEKVTTAKGKVKSSPSSNQKNSGSPSSQIPTESEYAKNLYGSKDNKAIVSNNLCDDITINTDESPHATITTPALDTLTEVKKPQQSKPNQKIAGGNLPQERVKTLVIKTLTEEAGQYVVSGRGDIDSGEFIIKMPLDIGENLAELVSSLIDPISNPHTEVSPVSLVEDM